MQLNFNLFAELYIAEVQSDENFHVGQDVHKWKSINLGGLSYAVGIVPKGLVILQAVPGNEKKKFIFSNNTICMNENSINLVFVFAFMHLLNIIFFAPQSMHFMLFNVHYVFQHWTM